MSIHVTCADAAAAFVANGKLSIDGMSHEQSQRMESRMEKSDSRGSQQPDEAAAPGKARKCERQRRVRRRRCNCGGQMVARLYPGPCTPKGKGAQLVNYWQVRQRIKFHLALCCTLQVNMAAPYRCAICCGAVASG